MNLPGFQQQAKSATTSMVYERTFNFEECAMENSCFVLIAINAKRIYYGIR